MEKSLSKKILQDQYVVQKKSVSEISKTHRCSQSKINYWLVKYGIEKRSISEAVYLINNPHGDPFKFVPPKNIEDAKLFGMGIGLYWGEGNKLNKNIVKLGNSDPALLKVFINFLIKFFRIDKGDLKYHLHIFSDISTDTALTYWKKQMGANSKQFYKPTITITGKIGTYRKKSEYGVLTVYYANTKLRNKLISLLPL